MESGPSESDGLRGRRAVPGFQVLHYRFPPGWRVPRHEHQLPALVVQLRGGYAAEIGRASLESRAGDLVTVPPRVAHREEIGPRGAEALIIAVEPRPADDPGGLPLFESARLFQGPRIRPILAKVGREFRSPDAVAPIALESALLELIAAADRLRQRAADGGARWLAEVHELLADELDRPPSLAELARRAGVSRAHLARSFRRVYGCSIGEFVRHRRLEHAASLLRSSDLPLADIALACGFYDQSHLCRHFGRQMGVTPSVWRLREEAARKRKTDSST